MSLVSLTKVAVGYSRAMDTIAQQTSDPEVIKDPAKLAAFQQQLFVAQSGYELAARTMQNINQSDKMLSELLRDA